MSKTRIVVVGGGTAGLTVSAQLLCRNSKFVMARDATRQGLVIARQSETDVELILIWRIEEWQPDAPGFAALVSETIERLAGRRKF